MQFGLPHQYLPGAPRNHVRRSHSACGGHHAGESAHFDNLFNGFPGADTVQTGMSLGVSVPLLPTPLGNGPDLDHSHTRLVEAVGRRQDGQLRDQRPRVLVH